MSSVIRIKSTGSEPIMAHGFYTGHQYLFLSARKDGAYREYGLLWKQSSAFWLPP